MKPINLAIFAFIFLSNYSNAISDPNALELLDRVRTDLSSLSANFDQFELFEDDQIGDTSSGKVWINSPNQFKWEYLTPAPQLIIADGIQVWIYDEDLEQVTIKKQETKQNPIYVLLNKEETESNYTISIDVNTDQDSSLTWVMMQPNTPSDEVKTVWLGINKDQLKVLKVQNQMENTVIFEFNSIIRNPEFEKGFFNFIAPVGTDIIQDTGVEAF